jgi:hypothetical protein
MAEASQVRVFGRGAIRPTAPGSSAARRRVYRPRGERVSSAAKAAIAAARPRDARGHFLPSAGGRDRLGGVVRPAARKGRGEPEAGDSVALSGAEVV